jgi:hypothetical protein
MGRRVINVLLHYPAGAEVNFHAQDLDREAER